MTSTMVVPFQKPDADGANTGDVETSYDPQSCSKALHTVLTYLLSDTFVLTQNEQTWVSIELQALMENFRARRVVDVPVAIRAELVKQAYSILLAETAETTSTPTKGVVHNGEELFNWVDSFSRIITRTFETKTKDEMLIYATLVNILTELGVGDAINPRATTRTPFSLDERND